jgi:hypothetical protein
MSGGFSFSKLKNTALHPQRTAKDYAAKKATNSLLGSFKMPSMPSIPGFGKKGANPMGQLGQLDTASKKGPALPSVVFQVIALITMSGMIGTFFIYIHKKRAVNDFSSIVLGNPRSS